MTRLPDDSADYERIEPEGGGVIGACAGRNYIGVAISGAYSVSVTLTPEQARNLAFILMKQAAVVAERGGSDDD